MSYNKKLSLYPLSLEQAVKGLLETEPAKLSKIYFNKKEFCEDCADNDMCEHIFEIDKCSLLKEAKENYELRINRKTCK